MRGNVRSIVIKAGIVAGMGRISSVFRIQGGRSHNIFLIIEHIFHSFGGFIHFLHFQYLPHYWFGITGVAGASLTASRPANPFVCCKDILSTFFVQVNMYIVVLGHFLAFLTHFADGHQMDNRPGMAQFQCGMAVTNLMDIPDKKPFSINIFMFFGFAKYLICSICSFGENCIQNTFAIRMPYVVPAHTSRKMSESENAVCWTWRFVLQTALCKQVIQFIPAVSGDNPGSASGRRKAIPRCSHPVPPGRIRSRHCSGGFPGSPGSPGSRSRPLPCGP